MASDNHVSSRTPQAFGNYLLARARNVPISATGNNLANLAVLDGGLTPSGSNVTSGCAIVRRITISNYGAGDIHTANVSMGWTNDGANLVANAQLLTNATANNTYADLTLSAVGNTTMLNGNVSSALFFNLVANAGGAGTTVDVSVYGDLIKA